MHWPCLGVAEEEDDHVPLQRKAGDSWRCGSAASPVKTKKGSVAKPRTVLSCVLTLTSSDHTVGFQEPVETRMFPQGDRQPVSSGR